MKYAYVAYMYLKELEMFTCLYHVITYLILTACYLDTDHRVHVDPCQMSGLYDGHTDLVVLGCQTVETAPTSAGTAGSYLIVMMYRYSTVRSSGYNILFTLIYSIRRLSS